MAGQPAYESDPHPDNDLGQFRYTIQLAGRDGHNLKLTVHEACAMLAADIRFSIFNDFTGEFVVSIPHTRIYDLARDTLTFVQD
jgi:hypothetical protein